MCAVLDSTETFHVGYGMKTSQLLRLWRITCQSSIKHSTSSQRSTPYQSPNPPTLPLYSEMVDSSVTLYVNLSGMINSHAGSSDVFLMFGCTTSNFMWLLSLSPPGDGKDEQPKSTGFSNYTACNMSFF